MSKLTFCLDIMSDKSILNYVRPSIFKIRTQSTLILTTFVTPQLYYRTFNTIIIILTAVLVTERDGFLEQKIEPRMVKVVTVISCDKQWINNYLKHLFSKCNYRNCLTDCTRVDGQ